MCETIKNHKCEKSRSTKKIWNHKIKRKRIKK